ncbi:MAG: DUF5916 domain-containing protein [Gemmatimonadetes bacterium]|nr:DUF5916 domain-containing protein [Gemmatimonadota bacterium]
MLLGTTGGEAQDPMPLTRLSGPIILDGLSDEAAWQDVPVLPLIVYQPTFGEAPTQRTEIRVAYDDDYLYVAGRMYDSRPDQIRTFSLNRDGAFSDDLMAIVLDTYNDYETAVWFTTNPAGVRSDRAISNDAQITSFRDLNSDWNTHWDVAVQKNGEGWFAEMRIPFSSLGFQDDDGHVVMGMSAYRWITRRSERHLFPAIPPDWRMGFAKPSQGQRVSFEGVYSKKPVYITPYGLGGMNREAELDSTSTGYISNSDPTTEIGGDLKYNITSNLTLDLTVNTDFAQVEVDAQQVNLTRFSLFFPEKRQFFQERNGLFEFNTGGQNRLFHSRQIGLNDGEPVRIYGGARVVGRVGTMDLGVLNMQTASERGIPAENFGVVRLRQRVFNPYSNIGGMATTRFGSDGSYNVAVGFDAVVRPFGDEYATLKWVSTFDDDRAPGATLGDGGLFLARWERRNNNGFSYFADYVRSGVAYDPGVGFVRRSDFSFFDNQLSYQWFMGVDSPFRSITLGNLGQTFLRNADKSVESASIEPSFQFEFKTGGNLSFSMLNSYESALDSFDILGGIPIPSGEYWFHEALVNFRMSGGSALRAEGGASTGSFYDGWRTSVRAGPTWIPSPHFEVGIDYQLNMIRFSDRNESLDAHLVGFRVNTAFDKHLSINTFVQYNSAEDDANINARLRYHFREGNDLWIVYTEGFNTDRDQLSPPRLPLSQNRVFLIKYTYTFIG